MDHFPKWFIIERAFFECSLTIGPLTVSLANKHNLQIGITMLNKPITINKNNWPCISKFQHAVKIENVLWIKINLVKVMMGAIKPIASKVAAIASSSNKEILLLANCI